MKALIAALLITASSLAAAYPMGHWTGYKRQSFANGRMWMECEYYYGGFNFLMVMSGGVCPAQVRVPEHLL